MSFTCYAFLTNAALRSVGPPAQVDMSAQYSIVDTTTNAAVTLSNNEVSNTVDVVLNCPVGSQNTLLPTVQNAIQAQESAHPSLTFIWLGL